MAIKKISELPIASAGDAVDGYVPVVIADDTKRVRVGDIGGTTSWDDVFDDEYVFQFFEPEAE